MRRHHLAFIIMVLCLVPLSRAGGQAGMPSLRLEATPHLHMYELYAQQRQQGQPTFVTSDSVLHATHVLLDYTLRAVEVQSLEPAVRALTGAMLAHMTALAEEEAQRLYFIQPPPFGYDRAAAYFGVAQRLLEPRYPLSKLIAPMVDRELALIREHRQVAVSPITGVMEDYTQYVPRGHYTSTEAFSRYFLAMLWYGRMGFPVRGEKAPGVPLTREEARANAWAGTVLAREMEQLPIPGQGTALVLWWRRLATPLALLVGEADDLTPAEYARLSHDVFGETLPGAWLPPAQAATDRFIEMAVALRQPQVVGTVQAAPAPPAGLKLLGQAAVPDALVLRGLSAPCVPGRGLPTGLDVMAALGSPAAEALLRERGDLNVPEYAAQLAHVRRFLEAHRTPGNPRTIPDGWLEVLRALVADPAWTGRYPEGYLGRLRPPWWNDPLWKRKQLNAGLGSWAELRHDTLLAVKQNYAPAPTLASDNDPEQLVCVEPVPYVYGSLIRLLSGTREALTASDIFPRELEPNYDELTRLLRALLLVATRDTLAPAERGADVETPTGDDRARIGEIAGVLRRVETLPEPLRARLGGDEDAGLPRIVDVYTDPAAGRVLEVGTGRVMQIAVPIVIAAESRDIVYAYGPIYTYYEFPHPITERLTDQAWQQFLAAGKAPPPFIQQ